MRRSVNQEFLGVDVGNKRIGIARGSTLARLAEPLKTVPAVEAVPLLDQLSRQNQVAGIVVGLPRNLDGQETGQTVVVKQWVEKTKTRIKTPFYWQDEALTSVAVEKSSFAAGLDAVAASVMLQDFLNTPPQDRVRA